MDYARGRKAWFVVGLFLALSCWQGPGWASRAVSGRSTIVVPTQQGQVQGLAAADHLAFLGLPFAAPPVGALRWKAPQPPAAWSGVRDATRFGPACPQIFIGGDAGFNEDCLYLNVYTPSTAGSRRPVMVWIHGGGFADGSGKDYDGSVLAAQHDVVVVTINYRLGPYGFLALPGLQSEDPQHSTGNYGIQDQQAALRWVRDNIAAFGGDPANVTLFGESAGGSSICNQMLAPQSAGLFHKAIVESGACIGSLQPVTLAQAEGYGANYAARLGCKDGDAAAVVDCLRGKSTRELLFAGPLGFDIFNLDFVPVIDGVVLPDWPATLFAAGDFTRVPVLQGTNLDEGRAFVVGTPHLLLGDATYPAYVRQRFGSNAAAVLAEYPLSTYENNPEGEAAYLAYSATLTDSMMSCPAYFTNGGLQDRVPVYAYEFADPHPPFIYSSLHMNYGAAHATELLYVFQANLWNGWLKVARLSPDQRALSTQMQAYWTQFARTGNPNQEGLPQWPRYEGSDGQVLTLAPGTGGIRAGTHFPGRHHCDFWAGLGH